MARIATVSNALCAEFARKSLDATRPETNS